MSSASTPNPTDTQVPPAQNFQLVDLLARAKARAEVGEIDFTPLTNPLGVNQKHLAVPARTQPLEQVFHITTKYEKHLDAGKSLAVATGHALSKPGLGDVDLAAYTQMTPDEKLAWDAWKAGSRLPEVNWEEDTVVGHEGGDRSKKKLSKKAEGMNLLYATTQATGEHVLFWQQKHPTLIPLMNAATRVTNARRAAVYSGLSNLTPNEVSELQTLNTLIGTIGFVVQKHANEKAGKTLDKSQYSKLASIVQKMTARRDGIRVRKNKGNVGGSEGHDDEKEEEDQQNKEMDLLLAQLVEKQEQLSVTSGAANAGGSKNVMHPEQAPAEIPSEDIDVSDSLVTQDDAEQPQDQAMEITPTNTHATTTIENPEPSSKEQDVPGDSHESTSLTEAPLVFIVDTTKRPVEDMELEDEDTLTEFEKGKGKETLKNTTAAPAYTTAPTSTTPTKAPMTRKRARQEGNESRTDTEDTSEVEEKSRKEKPKRNRKSGKDGSTSVDAKESPSAHTRKRGGRVPKPRKERSRPGDSQ